MAEEGPPRVMLSVGVVPAAFFIRRRVSAGDRPGGEGRFTRERETAPVQR